METNNANETKTRIYNLIILDKSGSMSSIRKAAYEGCNEVLGGILQQQRSMLPTRSSSFHSCSLIRIPCRTSTSALRQKMLLT